MTSPVALTGRLDPFCETGTEGVVWAVTVDGLLGYDSLFPLQPGDGLLIYGADGDVAWQGIVDLEYQRRYRPYPNNPKMGQQEVFGYWVHGFQRDLDPETWAKAFFDGAPAVIRPVERSHPAGLKEKAALVDQLASDPLAALRCAKTHPARQPVEKRLAWPLDYLTSQMKWKDRPMLNTEEEQARAWHLYLALQRADRAAWEPQRQTMHQRIGQRWPTPASITQKEIAHWAQHRLPHDPTILCRSTNT